MSKRSATDKAIKNLMGWADRPQWSDEQSEVLDEHLEPVCERLGIDQQSLFETLEPEGYLGMLFGVVFEDFVSRRFPPDGRNLVDDYLKRRGWRETATGRRYLQQLRDSTLSLYEVIEVVPGKHCDLRDLVRDPEGGTVRVFEHMGTQNLVKWDQLAARVLKADGKYIFSGGILSFHRDAAQSLLRVLAEARKQFDKELSRATDKKTRDRIMSSENQDDLFLHNSCPAFTSIWLMHTLDLRNEPLPEMFNRDGEAVVFTETRFPFLVEQFDEIVKRLDAAMDWERELPDEYTWAWLPEPDARDNKPRHGMAIETLQDGQQPLYGTLELNSGVLKFTANSLERAKRGQDILESLLHGLIGPALSKLQTPEKLLAEDETRLQDDGRPGPADSIDPEIAAEIIHITLDQHYRRVLDEPIPALGNKSPRQCAGSKKGREKVIDWLKQVENNELRRAMREGQAPYDCRWMWDELKLR